MSFGRRSGITRIDRRTGPAAPGSGGDLNDGCSSSTGDSAPRSSGQLRCVTTRTNRQPAVACYVLRKSDTTYRALAVDILRIEEGMNSEIVTFGPEVFGGLGLPITLDSRQGAGA